MSPGFGARAGLALVAAIALAACGGSTHRATTTHRTTSTAPPTAQTTTAAATASIDGCVSPDRETRLIRFRAPGELVPAAVVGKGSLGAVLANQTDNTVCEWLPLSSILATHGMRALLFDYGNGDYSAEVQAGASYLRHTGTTRLVLIGASIGGAVVIDAAVHMRPPPAAVISLSAVPSVTNYPFPADARRLTSPILHVGSTGDPLIDNGRVTRSLFLASPSHSKRLMLIPNSAAHGTDFGSDGQVQAAILSFISAHTRR